MAEVERHDPPRMVLCRLASLEEDSATVLQKWKGIMWKLNKVKTEKFNLGTPLYGIWKSWDSSWPASCQHSNAVKPLVAVSLRVDSPSQ